MKEYSFLTSVYKNTKRGEMEETVSSMLAQTVRPKRIVIVIDGPIPDDLKEYVDGLKEKDPELFTVAPIENNVGLGEALRVGTDFCETELIARMDTDDICLPDRCEKEIECFEKDESLSVVGSFIAEFIGSPENVVSERKVPEKHEDIVAFMKKRCPFNHVSVMMKKSELVRAGGYLTWHYDEDSYLWARMYLAGCKFKNIPENLVLVRIDENMFKRRGGYKYYKSQKKLFRFMKDNKIIGRFAYFKAKAVRFTVYVLMPNFLRQWFFMKFARK